MSDPSSERRSGARRAAGISRSRSDQIEHSKVPPHVFPLLQTCGDALSITDRYQHITYREYSANKRAHLHAVHQVTPITDEDIDITMDQCINIAC